MQRLYLIRQLQRFVRNNRAVAAVEFALVLPLLLAMYLASIEAATLYTADRKVATLASAIADLVSRQKGELAESDLDDYFTAAASIMQPLNTSDLGQVVSLVGIDEDGVATVKWSVAEGDASVREVDSPFPLEPTDEINQLARNASGWLVATEVTYPYQPIIGYIIKETINLKHVEYFLPRFDDEIVLDTDS